MNAEESVYFHIAQKIIEMLNAEIDKENQAAGEREMRMRQTTNFLDCLKACMSGVTGGAVAAQQAICVRRCPENLPVPPR